MTERNAIPLSRQPRSKSYAGKRPSQLKRHQYRPGVNHSCPHGIPENTTPNRPDTKNEKRIKGGIDAGDDARMRRQMSRIAAEKPAVVMREFSDRQARCHASELWFCVADMSATLAVAAWRATSKTRAFLVVLSSRGHHEEVLGRDR
jgi:hypothetical protein